MIASRPKRSRLLTFAALTSFGCGPALLSACGSHPADPGTTPPAQRVPGQHDYVSAPLPGSAMGHGAAAGDTAGAAPPAAAGPSNASSSTTRTVEETDLYALDGDRLFYLNAYRGLMVFDVSNVDQPKLVGRSPIFGDPVQMFVRNGIAVVVVGDWYGTLTDGTPFHGSVVRGIDARDPANIKITGEAQLGGWVRDTRVVGDVLYAVSEDYGWVYGWGYYGGGVAVSDGVAAPNGTCTTGSGSTGPKIVISSVSFANGRITPTGSKSFEGYNGIFNVTPNAIMLAHGHADVQYNQPGKTDLQYVDISDPGGAIGMRGGVTVNSAVNGWGADNGRWNLDFADGKVAHTIGCATQYCSGGNNGYVLSTVDFTNPDAPVLASELPIAATGWSPAARFDAKRMYLAPGDAYYANQAATPLQIFDLTSPTAPLLAGTTSIDGNVWLLLPDGGNRLFALGNEYGTNSSQVTLQYLDVTDPKAPSTVGKAAFGDGWAWTPAAGTFKAFTKDATKSLVVLPFSGWDSKSYAYNDGLQLIEYTPTSIATAGAAKTHGWVERGIFVKNRLVSMSDLALSVIDYSDHANPHVVSELTLARNVVNAKPQGGTIAEVSTDWWGYDSTSSEMRVLPIANAEETTDNGAGISVKIDGVDARVFQNGNLTYVVTSVQHPVDCANAGGPGAPGPTDPGKGTAQCTAWTQQVQIVDTSNGGAVLKGKVQLPDNPGYYGWGWGWYGCWYYDWFDGADVVQVSGDALAFRRWIPSYTTDPNGNVYVDAKNALYVVDLANPDAPSLASLTITNDTTTWWGNMKAIGNTLYTTHYEWFSRPDPLSPGNQVSWVKYYLDRIDLTDRAHPRVGSKINVPGVLVGASPTDPSLLYTVDYRWDGQNPRDEIAVVKVDGDYAYWQGGVALDGWVGNVIVRGDKAYASAQTYDWVALPDGTRQAPTVSLHQIDLADPANIVDHASQSRGGWGWLLGVEGDRALVTSGWGQMGLDVYRVGGSGEPQFDRFVRTRGWWTESLARQDNALFLSSGYWGVQRVDLQ